MKINLGFLGKHNDTAVFLNQGKYGFYLNSKIKNLYKKTSNE